MTSIVLLKGEIAKRFEGMLFLIVLTVSQHFECFVVRKDETSPHHDGVDRARDAVDNEKPGTSSHNQTEADILAPFYAITHPAHPAIAIGLQVVWMTFFFCLYTENRGGGGEEVGSGQSTSS